MNVRRMKKTSLLNLFIQNTLLITVTVTVLVIALLYYYDKGVEEYHKQPDLSALQDSEALFEEGKYDQVNSAKMLGKRGFFEVINDNSKLIYSSNSAHWYEFTPAELSYVQNVESPNKVTVTKALGKNGENIYLVTRQRYYSKSGDPSDYLILDDSYHVVESSQGVMQRDCLTARQFKILTQTLAKNYDLTKYTFKNKEDGENYTLVLFSYMATAEEVEEAFNGIPVLIGVFAFFYILIMAFYIWFNYHNVNRPLKLLQKTIDNYEKCGLDECEICKEHKEFIQLFDSFKAMTLRLTKSEELKEQMEQERNQMLANISHDIKTPITVIQGYSKAICDGLIPNSELANYFDTIYKKSCHLSELVSAFAEYSMVEHPEFKLNLKQVDICEFVREYCATKYAELEIEGFELEVDLPDEPVMVMIDTFQIERVFENVINNTMRYNAAGTKVYVSLECAHSRLFNKEDNKIQIHICDNGVGIPKEYQNTIFEPFIVADSARTNKGSGLGLSVVKRVMVAHGGEVALNPNPKSGWVTDFVLTFNTRQL